MKEQDMEQAYQYVIELLEQRRLKEAQLQIGSLLWEHGNWELENRLEQASTSYKYMLQYMRLGVEDPERRKLYNQLLADTRVIADQVRLSLLDESSTRYYHSVRNSRKRLSGKPDIAAWQKVLEAFPDDFAVCQLMPNHPGLDGVLQRHEQANQELFLATWSNSEWSKEEERQAQGLLASEMLPANDLCLFTSAVTLSLLECFDVRKLTWLLEAVAHPSTPVRQRAFVGVALTLLVHPDRPLLYPQLTARLSLLNETESFGEQLNRIYIELLRSQETEKIEKQMREEIIPEMMKSVDLMRNKKADLDENADENDFNPDWTKAFEESGFEDNMRKMNDLQTEGADLYMGTFAQLKNFPFFNELPNWFYPFDMSHSQVIKAIGLHPAGNNNILTFLLRSGFFCNSDKYSFCFTMTQLPAAQRTVIFNQMSSQEYLDYMDEEKAASMQQYAERPQVVSSQYIHDLYRFFKLNRRKHEFRDLFKEKIVLHRIPALGEILRKPELLSAVADFHFHKGRQAEALEIYQELIAAGQADAGIFQKVGYCLQKEKRYKEAIDAYRKADILKPDHLWTIRHLATCHRLSREFASALEYYQKALAMQPEDHNVLFYAGSCLAELERYEEALQHFFKLDFMEPDCTKAWRAIGWCSFACGKHRQAMKYYEKALASQPLAADYLNAGHAAWMMGETEKAIGFYGQAMLEYASIDTFREMFGKDREMLVKLGMNEGEIPLMLDMI